MGRLLRFTCLALFSFVYYTFLAPPLQPKQICLFMFPYLLFFSCSYCYLTELRLQLLPSMVRFVRNAWKGSCTTIIITLWSIEKIWNAFKNTGWALEQVVQKRSDQVAPIACSAIDRFFFCKFNAQKKENEKIVSRGGKKTLHQGG